MRFVQAILEVIQNYSDTITVHENVYLWDL